MNQWNEARQRAAKDKVIRIGFLAPLSGPVAAWGQPGLHGCEIWAERVNAAGGIKLADGDYKIEIVSYDDEYDPSTAATGAIKMMGEDGVSFIMTLGGDTWPGLITGADKLGMLISTLLPSDLGPKTHTLIAPAEVHPIYNVTGVEWLAKTKPHLKTAVMCAQDDALGIPSIATYMAAFEAAGITMQDEPMVFDPETTDFGPLVSWLISSRPDIVCLDTCFPDYVHPICEQLFQRGYKGQIISCTLDYYDQLIEKTSKEFVEGIVFQFPDFDDPALNSSEINFKDPNGFYEEYNTRFPGEWSAVSWEYASIMDLWKAAAEKAGTADPADVVVAMKADGKGAHAFGKADWWGTELFGIDNALVGEWPIVVIEDGKARIKAFGNIPEWYEAHGDLLFKHMKAYGQTWNLRKYSKIRSTQPGVIGKDPWKMFLENQNG